MASPTKARGQEINDLKWQMIYFNSNAVIKAYKKLLPTELKQENYLDLLP